MSTFSVILESEKLQTSQSVAICCQDYTVRARIFKFVFFLIAEFKKLLISFQKVYRVVKFFLKEHSHFNIFLCFHKIFMKKSSGMLQKLTKKNLEKMQVYENKNPPLEKISPTCDVLCANFLTTLFSFLKRKII